MKRLLLGRFLLLQVNPASLSVFLHRKADYLCVALLLETFKLRVYLRPILAVLWAQELQGGGGSV